MAQVDVHLSVVGLHQSGFDDVTIHMNETEEIETHGRSQAAQQHSGEDQAVLIRLMVRGQVVQIQDADLQHSRVSAHAQVRNRCYRKQLRQK